VVARMIDRSFDGTLIRFRAFGVPVRVEATFLATTVILGASRLSSAESFARWLGVVFVSILVHELGHALVGRRFGLELLR
jgi:stage IV sporulation protein FB